MPTRKVKMPDGTDILLVKHTRARNIRLTVTANGQIRVGMPGWVPYSVGMAFAKSNSDWISRQSNLHRPPQLRSGHRIGRSFRLVFIQDPQPHAQVKGRIEGHIIKVQSGLPVNSSKVQNKAQKLSEKALRVDSEKFLVPRLNELARLHHLEYANVSLRKLTSRWGSCSHKKNISLNIYLVQLPPELVDYVIMHELVHTKHLDHSPQFWQSLEELVPETPSLRRRLRKQRPRLQPA